MASTENDLKIEFKDESQITKTQWKDVLQNKETLTNWTL